MDRGDETFTFGVRHSESVTYVNLCVFPRFSPQCMLFVGVRSHHFMANRWGNSGWLYFLGSKITADGDCSHEIKRRLLLGRKVMINLDSILKSRDITLPTKVRLVKAMVFPVVMYGSESWTVKEAEHQRIDAFEVWCWRRLLRVPWTTRRSNQSNSHIHTWLLEKP